MNKWLNKIRLNIFRISFLFISNDHEPIHIHISKVSSEAKFNIIPTVKLIKNIGFKSTELKIIEAIIEENKEIIIEKWQQYFS